VYRGCAIGSIEPRRPRPECETPCRPANQITLAIYLKKNHNAGWFSCCTLPCNVYSGQFNMLAGLVLCRDGTRERVRVGS
jgi:hypothetical protein